jgi:hypothetical protein
VLEQEDGVRDVDVFLAVVDRVVAFFAAPDLQDYAGDDAVSFAGATVDETVCCGVWDVCM